MSGETDAALRQIEPEREPHRPAQPGIIIAFRRPSAFDEAAEHDAIAFGQAGFERTEDAHLQTGLRLAPHDSSGKRCRKELDIVRRLDGKPGGGVTGRELIECIGEFLAVAAGEGNRCAIVLRQFGNHLAMALGQFAEGIFAPSQAFERLQRRAEPGDEIGGGGKLAVGEIDARIGGMQIDRLACGGIFRADRENSSAPASGRRSLRAAAGRAG